MEGHLMWSLRQLIKIGTMPWAIFSQRRPEGIFFLIYHKVGRHFPLELDLPLPLFRRQLEFLHQTGRVVAYEQSLAMLQDNPALADDLFVLTFDDGYEDFYSHVFPLLKELGLPATLFVTTGFVEEKIAYPLRKLQLTAKPVTWDMLGQMAESGLITLGAHTHTHPHLVNESTGRVAEELERPIRLFQDRLGLGLKHFAYPHAAWDERTERLVKQYYSSTVVGVGQKATGPSFNPYRIPRVPVRASDGWLFFRAKVRGWLEAEEGVYSTLRRLLGSNR